VGRGLSGELRQAANGSPPEHRRGSASGAQPVGTRAGQWV